MSDFDTGLTTPELVRTFTGQKVGAHDDTIKALIRQLTDEIETLIGRRIVKDKYIDVLDGSSLGGLVLLHTPVIDFTSLTLNGTVVTASTYQVDKAAGVVELVSDGAVTAWTDGTRNYTATYTAGYEEIPAGIEGIATDIVARRLHAIRKDHVGLKSESSAAGGTTEFESREITDKEKSQLLRYGTQF